MCWICPYISRTTCYHLTHYWPAAVDIPVARVFPDHVGRFRTPYSVSVVEHHSQLKTLPVAVSPGFYSQQPDLAVSVPLHFRLIHRGAWRSGYRTAFYYRFSRLLHHGDITVSCQRQPSLPVTASFLAPWPVPDILCQFFQRPALARQLHLCTQPYQLFLPDSVIHLSLYCQGSGSPLPDADFQQEGADVHSGGFINHLAQLLCNMGSGRRRFSHRTG
ncbi:Uncharacterised protein [Klebsiella pneumoniae]|uniref:Uncharacterized protein n=1 Tax=Klebsiella pneumoniae TaxID=573 RepID=A0A377XS70_KLEPN|nr:Uncharacterised protein [Klebsiella pneumoniae]